MKNKRSSRKVPEENKKEKLESYRSEIKRLRKEVQQLRKELHKYSNRDESIKEFFEEYEIAKETETKIVETMPKCTFCKSQHIKILPQLQRGVDYFSCDACGKNGRLNAKKDK